MLELKTLYDTDLNLWVESQILALAERRFEYLDLSNLIEEVEDLARRDKRALRSHLEVLIMQLLKWQFQSDKRSNSWNASIANARIRIQDICSDSPSLKNYLPTVFDSTYVNARTLACKETGLDLTTFPEQCPYTLIETLDIEFMP